MELKFKVWDKVSYMSNPFTLSDLIQRKIEFTDDCHVLQFTGLKDKNGIDIYEGDILKWWVNSMQDFSEELLEVKWGKVGWVLRSPLFKKFGIGEDVAECSEINTLRYIINSEIIGNIYEKSGIKQ